jgi:hypothetical protein
MKPQVYYSTPYMRGNIGGGINAFVDGVPDGAWVCIRDADTLFLTHRQQQQIEDIVTGNPNFELIGCVTNRLRAPYQLHDGVMSDDPDIRTHIRIAEMREGAQWGEIATTTAPLAGMFMLFPKSIWERVGGMSENDIRFDINFSLKVIAAGGRLGVAKGIYLFHLYRFGKPDPCNYIDHLKS